MKWFWYQKNMLGRWAANLSDTPPSAKGTDGSKKLPLGPVYDLVKLTADRKTESQGLTSVDYTAMTLTELTRRFPPPGDEGSAPVEPPAPPLLPLPPAEVPVAPPLVPEAPAAPERAVVEVDAPLPEPIQHLFSTWGRVKSVAVFDPTCIQATFFDGRTALFTPVWEADMKPEAPVAPPLVLGFTMEETVQGISNLSAALRGESPTLTAHGGTVAVGPLVPAYDLRAAEEEVRQTVTGLTDIPRTISLLAPYGLGIEGIKKAYVSFVSLRLDATHPHRDEVHAALWKMKQVEGFGVISDLKPGAEIDRHIARTAELVPGWVEDFDAFQRVSPEIV